MTVHLTGHVAWRELAGETFVVDLKQRRMYGLNTPGSEVWKAICEDRDPVSNGGSKDQALFGAVRRFVRELMDLGLVSVSGSEATTAAADEIGPDVDDSAVPRVVWQEDLHAFAASCALAPSTTPLCNQTPST